MLLGNNHLGNIFAKVNTIKTPFASAKSLAIADCHGESRGLVSFNGQNSQKQKGPGTTDQSLFRFRNKFRKLYVLVMSSTRFRVNLHSIVA